MQVYKLDHELEEEFSKLKAIVKKYVELYNKLYNDLRSALEKATKDMPEKAKEEIFGLIVSPLLPPAYTSSLTGIFYLQEPDKRKIVENIVDELNRISVIDGKSTLIGNFYEETPYYKAHYKEEGLLDLMDIYGEIKYGLLQSIKKCMEYYDEDKEFIRCVTSVLEKHYKRALEYYKKLNIDQLAKDLKEMYNVYFKEL